MGSPAALQALASLTRLTWLDLSGTGVSAGLQHLTHLKDLAFLRLEGCVKVTDEHLQPLSALTGLTNLTASSTSMHGSSLAALSSLRGLNMSECSHFGTAGLAAVVQLTRLTFLDLSYSATRATPRQLAQLTRLTNLQELRVWGHIIREQAAALLELPRLGHLCANSMAAPQGHALGGCAITRLALDLPTAADLRALPQLPALQSLMIGTACAGISSISVQAQLTELVVGEFDGVQAGELAAGLRGLKQLQALELGHASCFDKQCLLAVAGMQQLQELWLDGGRQGLAPGVGKCWGMMHRCTQLRDVTLQRCGSMSQGVLLGLLSKPGMQRVVLRGAHGLAAEAVSELQELGALQGCSLRCEEEVCPGPLCSDFIRISM